MILKKLKVGFNLYEYDYDEAKDNKYADRIRHSSHDDGHAVSSIKKVRLNSLTFVF